MWSASHKWVVRYCDQEKPDFDQFKHILANEGSTPLTQGTLNSTLHFAAIGSSSVVLKYLLSNVPSILINQSNFEGETPLHWACQAGILENVKLLLSYGASYQKVDSNGNTPLHFAVNSGNVKLIKYLSKNMKNLKNKKNYYGEAPIDVACTEGEYKIVKYFVRAGCRNAISKNSKNKRLKKYLQAYTKT